MTHATLSASLPLAILTLMALLVATACDKGTEELRRTVIEEKVEERIAQFRRVSLENCRKRVLEQAGAIADSLLILNARYARDTLGKPPIPLRPDRPDLIPSDSFAPVRPLFRDTSLEVIDGG